MQELKGLIQAEISFDSEKFIDFEFGRVYGRSNLKTPIRSLKGYRSKVKARITQATPALISLCIMANRASLTRRVIGQIVDRMVMRVQFSR